MGGHCSGFPSEESVLGRVLLADIPDVLYLQDLNQCSCQGHTLPRLFPNDSTVGAPQLGHSAWHETSLMDSLCSELPISLTETFSELWCIWDSFYPVFILFPSLSFLKGQTCITVWRLAILIPISYPFILHSCLISSCCLLLWGSEVTCFTIKA